MALVFALVWVAALNGLLEGLLRNGPGQASYLSLLAGLGLAKLGYARLGCARLHEARLG